MECHIELVEALGNNALSYRTVERWVGKFQQGRVSTCEEQRSGRFTQGVANAEAYGEIFNIPNYEASGFFEKVLNGRRRLPRVIVLSAPLQLNSTF
ncbi:HTH_48 domain-containing protein [Trichonephila clavipes]|nr:HTH_48 domain-containing protein [Trichonephila clavipes]